jgi:hypothetical protein
MGALVGRSARDSANSTWPWAGPTCTPPSPQAAVVSSVFRIGFSSRRHHLGIFSDLSHHRQFAVDLQADQVPSSDKFSSWYVSSHQERMRRLQ